MSIAVEAVPLLVGVPIVEEEVMQQRPAYEGAAVGLYAEDVSERQAHIRDLQRVLVHADPAVLYEAGGALHLVGGEDSASLAGNLGEVSHSSILM